MLYIYIYMMYILMHLKKMLNDFKGEILSNHNKKPYGKPTLRLVPLVFFKVVVTIGVGVVIWLISYFRNVKG